MIKRSTQRVPTGLGEIFPVGWFIAATLLAVLAYAPTYHAGFLWNDSDYVSALGLQSWSGLGRIWTEVGATEQYYPVLHTTFWLEHRLWGDAAGPYHVANLAWHLLTACLLGLTLRELRIKGAWLAAAIFVLHPVCVESVAWISEQKNTLSSVFFFAAALVYFRYLQRPNWVLYAGATLLFLAALLSKSLTAVLPAALLVILWWRDGKLEWRRHFLPLLPWFVLGAAIGLFTAWVEKTYLGAVGGDFDLTWPQRLLLAGRIPWFYLGKLFWPADLVFIYPRWQVDPAAAWQWIFPFSWLGLGVIMWRRRWRGAMAGTLFFVGTLFPVLGFISLYGFLFSFVADHWQYLPCAGVIAWVAAASTETIEARRTQLAFFGPVLAAGLLVVLGVLSWRLTQPYRNLRIFYQTIVDRNPQAWMAHNNLGVQQMVAGEVNDAIAHYREALRLRPNYFEAENNLGQALDTAGDPRQAVEHYQRAVELNPSSAGAQRNLANALFSVGRFPESERAYRRGLVLQPDARANYNLAVLLSQTGRREQAVEFYRRALQLEPGYGDAHFNLASLLQEMGRLPEAVVQFAAALQTQPTPEAHNNLGSSLLSLNRVEEAERQFRAALQLDPNLAAAHLNLAIALRRLGKSDEAFSHAETARALMRQPSK